MTHPLPSLVCLGALALLFCACGDDGGSRSGDNDPVVPTGGTTATGGDTSAGDGGTSSGGTTSATGGAPENPGMGGQMDGTGGVVNSDCTPNPAGGFVLQGDVVFDERTCLHWMRTNASQTLSFDPAVEYCENLELGGYSDWRLPTAGEAASLITNCAGWPPVEEGFFENLGDNWTSSVAPGDDKICGAGLASKLFYTYGKVGPQSTRCVRGPSTVPDKECGSDISLCD